MVKHGAGAGLLHHTPQYEIQAELGHSGEVGAEEQGGEHGHDSGELGVRQAGHGLEPVQGQGGEVGDEVASTAELTSPSFCTVPSPPSSG